MMPKTPQPSKVNGTRLSQLTFFYAAVTLFAFTALSKAQEETLPTAPVSPTTWNECTQLSQRYRDIKKPLQEAYSECLKQSPQFGKVTSCEGKPTGTAFKQCHQYKLQLCRIREQEDQAVEKCRAAVRAFRETERKTQEAERGLAKSSKQLAVEVARLDVLAQEWTGRSGLDQLVGEKAPRGSTGPIGALARAIDAAEAAGLAAQALANAEEGGDDKESLEGIVNAFGEAELEANLKRIKAANKKIDEEADALEEVPLPSIGFDALLEPEQRQQYVEQIAPAIGDLEYLQKSYRDRAIQLRLISEEARQRSTAAHEADRFLSENIQVLGIARGMVFGASAEQAKIFAQSQQFGKIAAELDTVARDTENLAARYDEMAETAGDYARYLRSL